MWGWKKYIPVATRRAKAKQKMDQLIKKGKVIKPIEIQGRSIAKKFWGKLWCKHLETFSDFDNRLPRGRTYVRSGNVCHLEIKKERVEAIVIGSKLYNVNINFSAIKETKWKALKNNCNGQIGSLLELLTGKLSDHIMKIVANPKEGLFPNEEEIHFSCNCPDWADICKHVAAVFYGIGSLLDEQPDLLFLLRGVDASELITTKLATTTAKTEDLLEDEGLADIFGIDLDNTTEQQSFKQKKQKKTKSKTIKTKLTVEKKTPKIKCSIIPQKMSGKKLQKIRIKMKLTVGEFAKTLDVTPASVYRWEKKKGTLNLHIRSTNAIAILLEKNGHDSK